MTAWETLRKHQELEASMHNVQERLEETNAQIPQLQYEVRQAQAALLNAGGLTQLWNRLRGKEDDRETLERQARSATGALEAAQRERASLEASLESLGQELKSLGDPETLTAQLTGQEQEQYLRLKAGLHAEKALHLLHKCCKELDQAQYLARNPMMQVGDGCQENVHKRKAGDYADGCREQLECIQGCGIDFSIHAYLQNPMGYIVTARRFGDQDQMNHAQKALRQTEAALKELLLQLAE